MIEIAPYNPVWPAEFDRLAAALRACMGALALRIDHIGSTAVPGLAAKDRIDVQVTVAEPGQSVIHAMTTGGFEHRAHITRDHCPPGMADVPAQWAKLYFGPPAGARPANIHVRKAGNPNQRYPILFRDYLRHQPLARDAYAAIKHNMARVFTDTGAYADFKDPIVDLIWLAAEEWALRTGWKL